MADVIAQDAGVSIGPIRLEFPAVQAALSGYSDYPMRLLARRMGAPYTIHEVMIDRYVVDFTQKQKNREMLAASDEERPVAAQLMGSQPDTFVTAATRLVAAGFDAIDINFGCPVKSAMGSCRGGFHLSQPVVAVEILARVRDIVPDHIPVTLKMRKAVDDTNQSRDNFFRILDGAFDSGYAAVTVHGRTVEQRYVGTSDWNFLRELKQHMGDRVLFGSGDLFSAPCCVDMLRYTGVDGVSIARGAIGNPWIFRHVESLLAGNGLPDPPTVHEQRETILEHAALMSKVTRESRVPGRMKTFCIYYAKMHPQHAQVRDTFTKIRSADDFQNALTEWYSTDQPGQHPVVEEPNERSSQYAAKTETEVLPGEAQTDNSEPC